MRVLLIEDDTSVARGIELTLKAENFNTDTTDVGEGASILASCTTTTSSCST